MEYKSAFQQKLDELKRAGELRRLETLRKKYAVAPDYGNMSLHDELSARIDLDELNQLEQKFGTQSPQQTQPNSRLQSVVDNYNLQPRYGDATAKKLDNYLEGYQTPRWPDYFGTLAPVIDFGRNYADMYIKNLNPSDKFFHCKANYEAASRGGYGGAIAAELGNLREWFDRKIKGDSQEASDADLRANFRGRYGQAMGKTLFETCPTHHSEYK